MAESQRSQLDDGERRELELLYQNVTSNLEAAKKRQWQVLVFYSAVAAFLMSQVSNMGGMTRFTAAVAIFFGAFPTGKMILLYQEKMMDERNVLDRLYEHFSDKFKYCRRPKGSVVEPDVFEKWFCRGSGFYLMAVVILSTMTFVGNEIRFLFANVCGILGLQ